MKSVISFLVTVSLGFVFSLAEAATLSKLWSWYIQPQYGAGPHYSTWFGIAATVGLLLMPSLVHVAKDKDDGIAVIAARTVGMLIALPVLLGIAWATGSLFGWL